MGRCPDKRTVELPGVGTTDWSTEDEVGLSSEETLRRFRTYPDTWHEIVLIMIIKARRSWIPTGYIRIQMQQQQHKADPDIQDYFIASQ